MEKYLYKIKDKKTGLFSTGGMSPRWTKKGKNWTGMGPLKCHLRQFFRYETDNGIIDYHTEINRIPKNWVIVKFQILEVEDIRHTSAHILYPQVIKYK